MYTLSGLKAGGMPWAGAALGPHWHTALRPGGYRGGKEEKQDPEHASLSYLNGQGLRVFLSSPRLFLPLCFLLWHLSCSFEHAPRRARAVTLTQQAFKREQGTEESVRGQAKLSSCAFLLGIPLLLPS